MLKIQLTWIQSMGGELPALASLRCYLTESSLAPGSESWGTPAPDSVLPHYPETPGKHL